MSDIQSIQKDYEATEAKLAKLAKDLAAATAEKFTTLPAKVGLKTVDALIKALIPYASGVTKGKLKAAFASGVASKPAATPAKAGKRKPRARLDEEAKSKIVSALKSGGKAAAVAKEFAVSMATVNNLKKQAGLTKGRK